MSCECEGFCNSVLGKLQIVSVVVVGHDRSMTWFVVPTHQSAREADRLEDATSASDC